MLLVALKKVSLLQFGQVDILEPRNNQIVNLLTVGQILNFVEEDHKRLRRQLVPLIIKHITPELIQNLVKLCECGPIQILR